MGNVFSTRIRAGGGTACANAHIANTASLDAVVDSRMSYLGGRECAGPRIERQG